jgi:putative ABC transport system substrate-binding protein
MRNILIKTLTIVTFLVMSIFIFGCSIQLKKPHSVGIITLTEVDEMTINGFKDKLKELKYVEGSNIEYHYDGPVINMQKNFQKRIDSLKKKRLDLILVSSTPAAVAVKKEFEKSGIPIVFCPVSDPVSAGLVSSLKKPGANITGVKLVNGENQRLKWLKEIVPDLKTLLVPYTLGDKSALATIKQITPIAEELGIELILKGFSESAKKSEYISSIPKNSSAIFIPRDSRMESNIDYFVNYTITNKIPLSTPSFIQAEKGSLFSYGHVHYELGQQAGRLTHQIFSGVKPSNIPIELAENQFILNISTAKKISLALPDYLIKQADYVIKD